MAGVPHALQQRVIGPLLPPIEPTVLTKRGMDGAAYILKLNQKIGHTYCSSPFWNKHTACSRQALGDTLHAQGSQSSLRVSVKHDAEHKRDRKRETEWASKESDGGRGACRFAAQCRRRCYFC